MKQPILAIRQGLELSDHEGRQNYVRVATEYIDAKKVSKSKFRRNQSVTVINNRNGRFIVADVLGTTRGERGLNLRGFQCAMSYDFWDHLMLGNRKSRNEDGLLTIRPAKPTEVFRFYLNHPKAEIRVITRFGLAISAVTTILGAFLGVGVSYIF